VRYWYSGRVTGVPVGLFVFWFSYLGFGWVTCVYSHFQQLVIYVVVTRFIKEGGMKVPTDRWNTRSVNSCYSIISFICMFCRSLIVIFYFFFWPLCFLLRYIDPDYPFGIFKLCLRPALYITKRVHSTRHDIAEILLKVALKTKNQSIQTLLNSNVNNQKSIPCLLLSWHS
jgi:hypothetical protein